MKKIKKVISIITALTFTVSSIFFTRKLLNTSETSYFEATASKCLVVSENFSNREYIYAGNSGKTTGPLYLSTALCHIVDYSIPADKDLAYYGFKLVDSNKDLYAASPLFSKSQVVSGSSNVVFKNTDFSSPNSIAYINTYIDPALARFGEEIYTVFGNEFIFRDGSRVYARHVLTDEKNLKCSTYGMSGKDYRTIEFDDFCYNCGLEDALYFGCMRVPYVESVTTPDGSKSNVFSSTETVYEVAKPFFMNIMIMYWVLCI